MENSAARICVPAQGQCLERIRTFSEEILKSHTADSKLRRNLVLAIDEAAANIIDHAYPEHTNSSASFIDLSIEFGLDRIVIQILDQGIPFNPVPNTSAPLISEDQEAAEAASTEAKGTMTPILGSTSRRQKGGFGLRLIRNIVDRVEYRRTPFGENLLILTKRLRRSG